MDNTVLALKTMMVFLNSWNMTTDITFDNLVIDWFKGGHNRFNVFFEGKKIGQIGYENNGNAKLYFSSMKTFYRKFFASIEVDKNPLLIDFNIEVDSLTEDASISGNFEVIQNDEGLVLPKVQVHKTKYKSEFTKSIVKTDFTLGSDSLFASSIEDMYGLEKIDLEDISITYSYTSKDEEHPTSFLASVGVQNGFIAGIPTNRLVSKKVFKYEDVVMEDVNYQACNISNVDFQVISMFMRELMPNYQRMIKKVADSFEDNFPFYYWFGHLLDLCFLAYTPDEIVTLFGVNSKKVSIDGDYKSLNDLFDVTKGYGLVRRNDADKKLGEIN